jgi:DNA (cytosine-5)-methyltransferase 1
MQKIKLIDLYSGCGGMSLGFQNAGFEIVSAYDNWKPAVDVYRKNFKHPVHERDLSDPIILKELKSFNADIIIGGPPCQDFSIAGKRNFNGHRANQTIIFSNIITSMLPKWFVMENVYNIEKSPVLELILSDFKKAGYGITKGIFDASLMGVPQTRRRYFVIGKLNSKDDFLKDALHDSLSKKRMTVKEYLGDKLNTKYYYMHPRSYNRRAIFSVEEPSSTIRGVNRPIPESYTPHSADKSKNIKVVRALTSKERSFIQTFPNDFEFTGTKSAIEQMIGNAVPVKMAEFIARHIYSNFN